MNDKRTLTRKLIDDHLVEGEPSPSEPIAIRIDQTLTQDATGTLVMLALEAMDLDRVRTEASAQYIDHNLIQADNKNPDDHLFLASACKRFGVALSGPGGGVSHPVHMQRLGKPGKTLLGSDSHTCAAGSLGMLAIGAGGLDVAMAMAGEPFSLPMPEVWGVRLEGELPPWVSAKDVILEMLRRHGVRGGMGRVIEYHGPGLAGLSAMDRHVIANMGAELGATTSVFPSDEQTREFLAAQGRATDYLPMSADEGARYDHDETIDLSALEPLIAKPSSPGNVVPVVEVAGERIYQAYVGSSANPGFRDFAVCAHMVAGERIHPEVSYDVNPTSRSVLHRLATSGLLAELVAAGARLHQAGCNGCIGMGQAPATGRNSLRTTPRNFPGRSGTKEDSVWLCSPETATASALRGMITDPRELGIEPMPEPPRPAKTLQLAELVEPIMVDDTARPELVKGPNIAPMPVLDALPSALNAQTLLVLGDDVSTDAILPAGTRVLPYRSNIPKIAEFCFEDFLVNGKTYHERAHALVDAGRGHAVVAGSNYGQGSSREHAALAPRHLGLRLVIAESISRIHRANLINYGVLPLTFTSRADLERLEPGDELTVDAAREIRPGAAVEVAVKGKGTFTAAHDLNERDLEILRAGGKVRWMRDRLRA
ncbi:MAG: aconitate hydratase [Polyangiaceae bacterium]